MIDGAHSPGQIPLDLTALQADFYTGNCHKWLCAPKSVGFLYARRDLQAELVPFVVSWGIGDNNPFDNGSRFLDNLQWPGTIDQSAYLSVPAAIAFQREHDWDAVRESCHALVRRAIAGIAEITGLPPIYPGPTPAHQRAIRTRPASTIRWPRRRFPPSATSAPSRTASTSAASRSRASPGTAAPTSASRFRGTTPTDDVDGLLAALRILLAVIAI